MRVDGKLKRIVFRGFLREGEKFKNYIFRHFETKYEYLKFLNPRQAWEGKQLRISKSKQELRRIYCFLRAKLELRRIQSKVFFTRKTRIRNV